MLNLKKNIVATLAYFDMFDYPLSYSEIFLFLDCKCDETELREAINTLVSCNLIYQFDKFYSLRNEDFIITRRYDGNKKAKELLEKAKNVGQFLIKFPYVRGVGISGSLSKNFADENSDIDLFIITKKNRLWIARTFMHFFKKLTFLVNKQHYYCMNYYIDNAELEIVEKNLYTAIEVATLIPLQGEDAFSDFFLANNWITNFLPNNAIRNPSAKPIAPHLLKSSIEFLFNNAVGSWVDKRLMGITAKRWSKKTALKKLNSRGTIMGMCAAPHFAKPDPKNFQFKLIEKYQTKLAFLLAQTGVKLV